MQKVRQNYQNDLQMLGVINGEELTNDKEARSSVVVARKDLNGLYKRKIYCCITPVPDKVSFHCRPSNSRRGLGDLVVKREARGK